MVPVVVMRVSGAEREPLVYGRPPQPSSAHVHLSDSDGAKGGESIALIVMMLFSNLIG